MEIRIESIEEYQYAVGRGYEPLLEDCPEINAVFIIPNQLRVEIQDEKFKTIDKFYREFYRLSRKICEETGVPIPNYSAVNVSHILSRGAHPRMAKDLRNANLLTYSQHTRWEVGDRKGMKIFPKNKIKMEKLKHEYYGKVR